MWATRISFKDINTLTKFIKIFTTYSSSTFYELKNLKVNGKGNSFGVCVSDINEKEMNDFSTENYNSEEIALVYF